MKKPKSIGRNILASCFLLLSLYSYSQKKILINELESGVLSGGFQLAFSPSGKYLAAI